MIDEFPPELVERCLNAMPPLNCYTPAIVRIVLRESGHAEIVAALEDARPYVKSCHAFQTLGRVDLALAKAGYPKEGA